MTCPWPFSLLLYRDKNLWYFQIVILWVCIVLLYVINQELPQEPIVQLSIRVLVICITFATYSYCPPLCIQRALVALPQATHHLSYFVTPLFMLLILTDSIVAHCNHSHTFILPLQIRELTLLHAH